MRIPMTKQFLCGCSVYTGSLIIGWIHLLVTSVAVLSSTCFGIMMIPRLSLNETRESLRDYIETYSKQSSPNGTLPDYILDQEVDAAILIIKSIWLIIIVFAYVNFAADVSLLVGVYKRVRMCLIPWLILAVKNVIFSLISVVIWILYIPIFLFGEHSHSMNAANDFYVLFGYSFFLICNSYFWIYTALTVFTHYRELSYHETQLAKNFQKL